MSRLSISAAWDESKAVLAHEGRLLVAVALALLVLPGVVLTLISPSRDTLPQSLPGLLAMLAILLITIAGQLAVIRLAMGPHLTVGEAIAHGFRRVPSYIASILLWMVPGMLVGGALYAVVLTGSVTAKGVAALAILLIIAFYLIIAVRLILSSAVASAEQAGPVAIIRRSFALTRGHWFKLFGFLVLLVVAAGVLLMAVSAISGLAGKMMFGSLDPMTPGLLVVALAGQLVSAMVSIVFFVMLARIYVQLTNDGAAASVPSSAD